MRRRRQSRLVLNDVKESHPSSIDTREYIRTLPLWWMRVSWRIYFSHRLLLTVRAASLLYFRINLSCCAGHARVSRCGGGHLLTRTRQLPGSWLWRMTSRGCCLWGSGLRIRGNFGNIPCTISLVIVEWFTHLFSMFMRVLEGWQFVVICWPK